MSPSIRRVPTAPGATAVQIIWRYRNRKPEIEHVGSAHTDHDLAALMVKAQRLVDGEQISLDLKVLPSAVAVSGTGTVDNPVTGLYWGATVPSQPRLIEKSSQSLNTNAK